ncbi:MAG: hypothetical protein ABIH26_11000, partial [Candidatus Eisenbacteria bacterium]
MRLVQVAVLGLFFTCLIIPSPASAWSRPAVPAPGAGAAGDPEAYGPEHARALDPVYDTARPGARAADLMAFHYDQNTDRLAFRVQVAGLGSFGGKTNDMRDTGTRFYFALDYADGGTTALPDGIRGEAPIRWDRVLRIGYGPDGGLEGRMQDSSFDESETEGVKRVNVSFLHDMVEGSIGLPGGFEEAAVRAFGKSGASYEDIRDAAAAGDLTPVRFYVFTARGSELLDDIAANNESRPGDHNVAFMVHGNQGLTWTTVFYGEREENASYPGDPDNPDDGFDELLDCHRYYQLPLNIHLAGQLQSSAEWHNPEFNDSIASAVAQGWGDIITSAYAQHMMPFVQNNMN